MAGWKSVSSSVILLRSDSKLSLQSIPDGDSYAIITKNIHFLVLNNGLDLLLSENHPLPFLINIYPTTAP
jgi:hypothetical protein